MKDLLVIGGGPAGLSAAIEASRCGADVTVIDDNPQMGGQLCKQTHKFFGSSEQFAGIRGFEIAKRLTEEAESLSVNLRTETRALGVLDDGSIALLSVAPDSASVQTCERARTILLAVGARENALSFPGCTLPGVMGAGAAQTFANQYGVLAGKRILMVGSGNVGLIVSYQLMQAGAEIAGIIEAASAIGGYAVHAAKIRRAGVPVLLNHTIVAAEGTDHVRSAVIAELDGSGSLIDGTWRRIECDTVLLAVGLSPRTELAAMLHLPFIYDRALGGRVPVHDDDMQSGIPFIYVAGDAAGVEEASIAMIEGRLAGLSAAEACGLPVPGGRKQELLQNLSELRTDSAGKAAETHIGSCTLQKEAFRTLTGTPVPEEDIQAIREEDPVICRCEGIRRSEIERAIQEGCTSVSAVRRATRSGMGSCQGRTCGRMIEAMLRTRGIEPVSPAKARYPLVPCSFSRMEEQS